MAALMEATPSAKLSSHPLAVVEIVELLIFSRLYVPHPFLVVAILIDRRLQALFEIHLRTPASLLRELLAR